jgi:hypothetical protein
MVDWDSMSPSPVRTYFSMCRAALSCEMNTWCAPAKCDGVAVARRSCEIDGDVEGPVLPRLAKIISRMNVGRESLLGPIGRPRRSLRNLASFWNAWAAPTNL